MSMVKSTRFWIDQFDRIHQKYAAGSALHASEAISAEDAAQKLISSVFPDVRAASVRSGLRQWATPKIKFQKNYPSEEIEKVIEAYRQSELEPSGYDVVAIIFETSGQILSDNALIDEFPREHAERMLAYRNIYPAVRVAIDTLTLNTREGIATVFDDVIDSIDQEAEKQKNAIYNQIRGDFEESKQLFFKDFDKKRADTFSSIAEEKTELLTRFEDEAENRLNNKINALTSDLILGDARNLWRWKAVGHKVAFWIATLVFISLIIGPIYFGVTHWGMLKAEIYGLFPDSEKIPFGRLLIITIPLVGYAWVLRLISRYLNQNLTLGQDADLRKVLVRTFVQLVSEGAANDDKDRAIILGALFRPMPGTNTEDDQPPNIIGMIRNEFLLDKKK